MPTFSFSCSFVSEKKNEGLTEKGAIMRVLVMEDLMSYGEEVTLVEDVMEKVEDGMEEPSDWLPDGRIMEM